MNYQKYEFYAPHDLDDDSSDNYEFLSIKNSVRKSKIDILAEDYQNVSLSNETEENEKLNFINQNQDSSSEGYDFLITKTNQDSSTSEGYDVMMTKMNQEENKSKQDNNKVIIDSPTIDLYQSSDFKYDFCDSKKNNELIPYSSLDDQDILDNSNWNIQFQSINNIDDGDEKINKIAAITKNFHFNAKVRKLKLKIFILTFHRNMEKLS